MKEYQKSIIPHIESLYESFTPSEKSIADFFIHNTEESDISSKALSKKLFVSEASISRFAKKCGFDGYRQFAFVYKESFEKTTPNITASYTKQVLDTYEELLNKSYTLIDEEGKEQAFELLDVMEIEDQRYFALLPYFEDPEEAVEDDGDLVVLKAEMVDGEEMMATIDDDEEYERIGNMFLERISEMFEDEFDDDPDDK